MASVVYFIKCEKPSRIKIGTSSDPANRLRQLRTSNPAQLELMGSVPGSYSTEAAIHDALAEWRCDGEWFMDCKTVNSFITCAITFGIAEAIKRQSRENIAKEEKAARRKASEARLKIPMDKTGVERLLKSVGFSRSCAKKFIAAGWPAMLGEDVPDGFSLSSEVFSSLVDDACKGSAE